MVQGASRGVRSGLNVTAEISEAIGFQAVLLGTDAHKVGTKKVTKFQDFNPNRFLVTVSQRLVCRH